MKITDPEEIARYEALEKPIKEEARRMHDAWVKAQEQSQLREKLKELRKACHVTSWKDYSDGFIGGWRASEGSIRRGK